MPAAAQHRRSHAFISEHSFKYHHSGYGSRRIHMCAHSLHVQGELPSPYIAALKLVMMLVHRPHLAECAAQVCTNDVWMCLGMEWWENIHLIHGEHQQNCSALDHVGYEAII